MMYLVALIAAGFFYVSGAKTDAWIMLVVIGLFIGIQYLIGV